MKRLLLTLSGPLEAHNTSFRSPFVKSRNIKQNVIILAVTAQSLILIMLWYFFWKFHLFKNLNLLTENLFYQHVALVDRNQRRCQMWHHLVKLQSAGFLRRCGLFKFTSEHLDHFFFRLQLIKAPGFASVVRGFSSRQSPVIVTATFLHFHRMSSCFQNVNMMFQ